MIQERIIEVLQERLRQSWEREQMLLEQVHLQSVKIEQLTDLSSRQALQIEELIATVHSLEESIRHKDSNIESLKAQMRGLGKLISNKSEKISVVTPKTEDTVIEESRVTIQIQKEKPVYNPKERGNNNAKRKEFFDIETVIEDVFPDDPSFDMEKAKNIGYTDSILYKFIPGKFIKHIYRQWNYAYDDKVYSGKASKMTPFFNSNYDSSFIAGIIQLRYIYSMPVQRIVNYFGECGFELKKSTAHGFIAKSAAMMDRFETVLKKVILQTHYINMDETYYTVLTDEKNEHGKGVRKGYIWAALSTSLNLIQFFYENGSRTNKVFTDYVETDYHGAIQSDGLSNYKVIETDAYPNAFRLACFQHCKRKFLDILPDKDAVEIVDTINSLYHNEHQIKEDWTPDEILKYRQQYAPPILNRLKERLTEIQNNPQILPKSLLAKATNYMLGQFDALSNYILRHDYALDNNAIERCMRYISLSRKNSLFCGSHAGAKRMALIYSLACSCRLNNINSFEYFKDILNRLAEIKPNAPDDVFIELLPHKWRPKIE